ncbi:NAD(P)/FAD-dependent oxidoreductase [Lutimonas zeaxanthinifaciens]|uniref:NAD(P)/FAD-dependent oxidoreductase n=1 Tax=Lutimonas zeaxanthinifaciens TaxID=3060215 RepID=UPI00265D3659|nr:NAD(P)/FAD-dependent oxidoreductase [Lutimonas sp. YSD2104]WKK65933.1 NAD(P)/FAD-dependent oxidoreductase [Lutimonas sp. YSD2104]
MDFDVLIVGGGVAGMSAALVLGSAKNKPFARDKNIGIIMHQRTSALNGALFNNVLGIPPGTTGNEILENGRKQLSQTYPHVIQIEKEKVNAIESLGQHFNVVTNKGSYSSKIVIIAVGPSNLFNIKGLEQFIEPHQNLPAKKERIQLKNSNHKIQENLFVAGVLAGWRSQFATAAGSGAHVATDILTIWNGGQTAMVHDSEPK